MNPRLINSFNRIYEHIIRREMWGKNVAAHTKDRTKSCKTSRSATLESRLEISRARLFFRGSSSRKRKGDAPTKDAGTGNTSGALHVWAARVYISPPELRPEFRRRGASGFCALTRRAASPSRMEFRGVSVPRSLDGHVGPFFPMIPRP